MNNTPLALHQGAKLQDLSCAVYCLSNTFRRLSTAIFLVKNPRIPPYALTAPPYILLIHNIYHVTPKEIYTIYILVGALSLTPLFLLRSLSLSNRYPL